jgi:hypothetical protein
MRIRGRLTNREWQTADRIGSGSLAEVFGLHQAGFVLKRYRAPLHAFERDRIEQLCRIGISVAKQRRHDLSQICWPRDYCLTEDGRVAAVVMPHAGPAFFEGDRPRQLGALFAASRGTPFELRLRVVRRLAAVLEYLGGTAAVHGDISGNNVLWTPDGAMLLIDSDGLVGPRLPSRLPRNGSPRWVDPRLDRNCDPSGQRLQLIRHHDLASDAYGLGLAAYRAITRVAIQDPGRGSPVPDVPCELARLFGLLREDPRNERGLRPRPEAWKRALDEARGDPQILRALDRWGMAERARRDAEKIPRKRRGGTAAPAAAPIRRSRRPAPPPPVIPRPTSQRDLQPATNARRPNDPFLRARHTRVRVALTVLGTLLALAGVALVAIAGVVLVSARANPGTPRPTACDELASGQPIAHCRWDGATATVSSFDSLAQLHDAFRARSALPSGAIPWHCTVDAKSPQAGNQRYLLVQRAESATLTWEDVDRLRLFSRTVGSGRRSDVGLLCDWWATFPT